MPSPFASMPHRAHVDGMNCIQPIAPAELGPRFCPKFVSTLLIAASTSHGMPYALPAACQMGRRDANVVPPCCCAVGLVVNGITLPWTPARVAVFACGLGLATR